MSKSGLLRIADVRDIFRLIGDCRDLGSEPNLWHQRAFEGLSRLIGGSAVTGGEGYWLRPYGPVQPVTSHDTGLEATTRNYFLAFMREGRLRADLIFDRLQQISERLVTRKRTDLVSDRDWYQC